MLVLLFTGMTVCCTLVKRNVTRTVCLNSSEQEKKTYETKETSNPSNSIQSIKDVSLVTSRGLEIEYEWSDPNGLLEDVVERIEGIRPFVPVRILGKIESKECIVRYIDVDGVQSTRCGCPH